MKISLFFVNCQINGDLIVPEHFYLFIFQVLIYKNQHEAFVSIYHHITFFSNKHFLKSL